MSYTEMLEMWLVPQLRHRGLMESMLLQDDAALADFIRSFVLCIFEGWGVDQILLDIECDRVPEEEKNEKHTCKH